MKIIITGGLGYIGSHICVDLMSRGFEIIIVDNLSNSNLTILNDIESIVGKAPIFYKADLRNDSEMNKIFDDHAQGITAVIHCAGDKSVIQSKELPLKFYENNLNSTISLLKYMDKYNINHLVSSASVYGVQKQYPIKETAILNPLTPYARSKMMIEEIDYAHTNEKFRYIILRYFNPIGKHYSGLLKVNSMLEQENLVSYINKVANKINDHLNIYGVNFETKDGTAIRDFIHIEDLAEGHYKALNDEIDINVQYF